MSILTGPEIERVVERTRLLKEGCAVEALPTIEIEPFDPKNCGPNSYDVTLSNKILVYGTLGQHLSPVLDMKKPNQTEEIVIPLEGFVLYPGRLYLGCTNERTRCEGLVPWFDGRSSVGRLGLFVHVTAGRGDDGWPEFGPGRWTLEMVAVQPIHIYPNVRIGQISFMTTEGDRRPYRGKYSGRGDGPQASQLWRDFVDPEGVK